MSHKECKKFLMTIDTIEDTDHVNIMVRPQLWENSPGKGHFILRLSFILADLERSLISLVFL